MTPGSCCVCGLPVRDHTTHLCAAERNKPIVSPVKPPLNQVPKGKSSPPLRKLEEAKFKPPDDTSVKKEDAPRAAAAVPAAVSAPLADSKMPSSSLPLVAPAPLTAAVPLAPISLALTPLLTLPQIIRSTPMTLPASTSAALQSNMIVTSSGFAVSSVMSTSAMVTPSGSMVTPSNAMVTSSETVTPDMQLWLNTMSRAPSPQINPAKAAENIVKTIGQHSTSPTTSEGEREHKQAGEPPKSEIKDLPAHKACDIQKTFTTVSDRQSSLKGRLGVLSKRLFRFKTRELVRHIVSQLDKFDDHAIKNQVEPKQQLPCRHKFEDRPPSHARPLSAHHVRASEPPMDGHAFSTLEKLRVSVGQELLCEASTTLARYDDEKTDSSSDEEEPDVISEANPELLAIEQRWERERAQIAAQWTWIRGQYEDLQHRMRRESDLLSVYREKKDKVVLLPNDHYMKDHVMTDKFAHHPAMVPPPLNGYHNHPLMKNNFVRTGQEMYLKSNAHKRINKTSKIDGNTCARTRPLACMIRRNVFTAKEGQRSIARKDTHLRRSMLGKHCNGRNREYGQEDNKHDSAYHPVLSRRTETHLNVHLTPLLSGVDYFPSAERKSHPPPEPRQEPVKEKVRVLEHPTPSSSNVPESSTPTSLPITFNHVATFLSTIGTSEVSTSSISEPCTPPLHCPKKRSIPGATVEHMIKKYRTSNSQPGSRCTSPVPGDKKKKSNNQFDIHNIEVDFSVVAPARIERPRYKEIEIPKFRLIPTSKLEELACAEDPSQLEEDTFDAYEALHSRCEHLEKVRFINMQINATGGMRGANHDMLSPALILADDTLSPGTPLAANKHSLPPSDKRTLFEQSDKRSPNERSRVPSVPRQNNGNNKHVTYLEDEIRITRASKHTTDYPTAVS